MPIDVLWPLTQRWYGDRIDPDYEPSPVEALQAILTDVGLTAPFWQLR